MRRTVSSAFFMLLGMAFLIGFGLLAAWPFVNFASLFNVASPSARLEAGPAMAILVACFLVGLPLTVSNQVQQGNQDGWKSSLWSMAGSLLSLGLVFEAVAFKVSLPILVLAMAGAPVLAQIGNTCYLFGFEKKWLAPDWRAASKGKSRALLNLGLLFAVVQMSAVVAYQLDNFVITRIMGPSAVPCYVLTQRLFMITPMIIGLMLVPLRPAYSEALTRGDSDWVIGSFKRSVRLAALLNIPVAFMLFFAAPFILRIWLGADLVPSFSLRLASALWLALQSLDGPLSVFLNGIGWMKIAAVMAPLQALVNLGLSIVFTRRIGVAGPIFGTLAALLLVVYLPMLFILPKLLKGLARGETSQLS